MLCCLSTSLLLGFQRLLLFGNQPHKMTGGNLKLWWTLLLFSGSVVLSSLWPPWTAAHQASLSFTISWSWLICMSSDLVMLTNHLILCHPILLLPSIFPSIKVFSNDSVLHIRCPKYWSFSYSVSPSNEYSGLVSFRIDLLDLFAVQGTLKSSIAQLESINSLALSLLLGLPWWLRR